MVHDMYYHNQQKYSCLMDKIVFRYKYTKFV